MPFYAVRKGRSTGIFLKWSECEEQVKGFNGARFKKFDTEEAAEMFVQGETVAAIAAKLGDCGKKDDKLKPTKRKVESDDKDEAKKTKKTKKVADNKDYFLAIPGDISKSGKPVVYTDGCCHFNGKQGAIAGLGVYWGPGDKRNLAEPLQGRPTNNRAEIHAANRAVEQAKQEGYKQLLLYTDSKFLIKSMTEWIAGWKKRGWKKSSGEDVINTDDFKCLDDTVKGIDIQWEYVPGHQGILGNEEADKLANIGAKSHKKKSDEKV